MPERLMPGKRRQRLRRADERRVPVVDVVEVPLAGAEALGQPEDEGADHEDDRG